MDRRKSLSLNKRIQKDKNQKKIGSFFRKSPVKNTAEEPTLKNDLKSSASNVSLVTVELESEKLATDERNILPATPENFFKKSKIGKSTFNNAKTHSKSFIDKDDITKREQKVSCNENLEKEKISQKSKKVIESKTTKRLSLSKSLKRKNVFKEEKEEGKKKPMLDEVDFISISDDDNELLLGYLSTVKHDPHNHHSNNKINMKDDMMGDLSILTNPLLETDFEKNKTCKSNTKKHTMIKKKKESYFTENDEEIFNDMFSEIDEKSKPATVDLSDDSLLGIDFNENFSMKDEPGVILVWIVTKLTIRAHSEKIVHLHLKANSTVEATCHLRNDWFYMDIDVGDQAFVSGLTNQCKHCILDNNSDEYITLYPNTLISGTTIASGISCERQAVLNERFKMENQNQAMLLGTMVHDLFDEALLENKFTVKWLEEKAKEYSQSPKYLDSLYQIGFDENELLARMKEYFPPIDDWAKSFLQNKRGKEIEFHVGSKLKKDDPDIGRVIIDDIVDIEENIWDPCHGFKGKIDVSVSVTVHKRSIKQHMKSYAENYLLPLELKTGKMWNKQGSIEHRAQLAVYAIMMSSKYHQDIASGLLYYIKSNHMQGVPMPAHERRAITIKRNEIAKKITLETDNFTLPGLLRNERFCKRCSQNKNCMLYYKSMEDGNAVTSGVSELFTELTSHLSTSDLEYFTKWYKLIREEASFSIRSRRNKPIWEDTSKDLESKGQCYSNMIICKQDMTSDQKLHYTFKRDSNHFNKGTSLKYFTLNVGDRVIISKEKENVFNITTGYILSIDCNEVTISVSHKILSNENQVCTYRVDHDRTLSSFTTPFTNIAKLFSLSEAYEDKLRRLIIGKEQPTFNEEDIDKSTSETIQPLISKLNKVQQVAIRRCLAAKDYLMILGMPGAGKSTTVAALVQVLSALGKTVLLTSYTHSAVDTILIKLINMGFTDFIRLGQSSKVHPLVKPYTCIEKTQHLRNTTELGEFYKQQKIIATTSLSVNHPVFTNKHFDFCIVDEASQITQPVCLGPIRYAKSFILVGDHNQLPPLVQSEEARKNGLDISLFKYLADLHPLAVVTLNYQYRMNKEIMSLTNHLVYNQQMECGNSNVANSFLYLKDFDQKLNDLDNEDYKLRHIYDIISPKQPVVFVNTDTAYLFETKAAYNIINQGESLLVARIIKELVNIGLNSKDIGVITPYRHQIKIIRDELIKVKMTSENLEVDTVDKYQGKDKSCIIVSFVRKNTKNEVGELLKDWRRINVAVTRAKTKLILVGSKETLVNSEILKKMIEYIELKNWIIDTA